MPTIRIDDDVYEWLQAQATPFEDTPNTVLRRISGLVGEAATRVSHGVESKPPQRRVTGRQLAREWGVEVKQALYHRDGKFFENLREFPGGLFDPTGYVVFATRAEYEGHRSLRIGQKLNVPDGILSVAGYVRVAP